MQAYFYSIKRCFFVLFLGSEPIQKVASVNVKVWVEGKQSHSNQRSLSLSFDHSLNSCFLRPLLLIHSWQSGAKEKRWILVSEAAVARIRRWDGCLCAACGDGREDLQKMGYVRSMGLERWEKSPRGRKIYDLLSFLLEIYLFRWKEWTLRLVHCTAEPLN